MQCHAWLAESDYHGREETRAEVAVEGVRSQRP